MSRSKSPSLLFDKRTGAWIEDPKSGLQVFNDESDDFHAGIIVGICIAGVFWTCVLGLATVVSQLL